MFSEELSLPLWIGASVGVCFLMATMGIIVWQILKSRTTFDRVLALDLMGGTGLCLFVLLSISMHESVLLDAAFAIAVVSFIGTVAFAKYLVKETD